MEKDIYQYNTYAKILHNTFLFNKVDNKSIKTILQHFSIENFTKGENINPDLSTKYLYIIVQGKLKITNIDPKTGRSIALFILHSGDIHDIFTLLDGKEHIVFPIALDDVVALKIPLNKARKIINDYPEFNARFLPYLGKRLRELENFSESLVFDDTATRLSKLILKHIVKDKENNTKKELPLKLINNLSHESLSELIGSVRSVVSIKMEQLKKDGIIVSKRGYLAVKDIEKLIEKCDIFKGHNK